VWFKIVGILTDVNVVTWSLINSYLLTIFMTF